MTLPGGAGKVAHQVEAPATKPGDLNLIPGTQRVKRTNPPKNTLCCTDLPEAKTGGGFPSRLSTSVLKSGILGSSYATTSLQNTERRARMSIRRGAGLVIPIC